jgi:hypothetical protein
VLPNIIVWRGKAFGHKIALLRGLSVADTQLAIIAKTREIWEFVTRLPLFLTFVTQILDKKTLTYAEEEIANNQEYYNCGKPARIARGCRYLFHPLIIHSDK